MWVRPHRKAPSITSQGNRRSCRCCCRYEPRLVDAARLVPHDGCHAAIIRYAGPIRMCVCVGVRRTHVLRMDATRERASAGVPARPPLKRAGEAVVVLSQQSPMIARRPRPNGRVNRTPLVV